MFKEDKLNIFKNNCGKNNEVKNNEVHCFWNKKYCFVGF